MAQAYQQREAPSNGAPRKKRVDSLGNPVLKDGANTAARPSPVNGTQMQWRNIPVVQLIAEALPVYGLDPIEFARDGPGLVSLELSNEVPIRVLVATGLEYCSNLDEFAAGFLDIVFGNVAETRPHRRRDPLGGHSLAGADQSDRLRGASGSHCRRRDTLTDAGDPARNLVVAAHGAWGSPSGIASNSSVSSSGSPMTLLSLPSTRSTKRRPPPWSA